MDAGARCDLDDYRGYTPLDLARNHHHAACVALIEARGADDCSEVEVDDEYLYELLPGRATRKMDEGELREWLLDAGPYQRVEPDLIPVLAERLGRSRFCSRFALSRATDEELRPLGRLYARSRPRVASYLDAGECIAAQVVAADMQPPLPSRYLDVVPEGTVLLSRVHLEMGTRLRRSSLDTLRPSVVSTTGFRSPT